MRQCFVISPIGPENSGIRKNADYVFEKIIKPAMDVCDFKAFRSDHLDKPGRITDQMFEAIFNADLCIADLTGRNPNVYYELAIAQSAKRPVIILINKKTKLPFDVRDLRCIYYDFDTSALEGRKYSNKIVAYIKEFEDNRWEAQDLFSKFRPTFKPSELATIDFDDIKSQLEKTIIFKMINLKSVDESPETIYEKYIPRLKKSIGVVSEFMTIRVNKFDRKVEGFKSKDTTSGDAIELNSLLPFHFNLEDTDKKPDIIQPTINGPSNVYVAIAHTYNGFRFHNLDFSTKAEKNTNLVRLIIDFSSIPNFENIIPERPVCYYCPLKGSSERDEI